MNYQNTQHRSGLMNLIAEFVVKLLDVNSKTKSIITVTDQSNFIVINGQTNSNKIFDVNELRTMFTKNMPNLTSLHDISKINIIDLIEYKPNELSNNPKKMNFIFYNSSLPRMDEQLLDKIKQLENLDYSEVIMTDLGVDVLIPFENCHKKQHQSTFPYGYSLNNWKGIFLYLEYVSLNVFPMIKGNFLKFEIDSDFNFSIVSDSLYESHLIESLIKDVFDFDIQKFISDIKNYDMTNDCLLFVDRPWLIKDKVRDSIIF